MGNDLSNPNLIPKKSKKYGGFTNDQVKEIRKNFELICDSEHNLDRKKLGRLFKGSPQELDAVFEFLDVEKGNEVTEYELICSLSSVRQMNLHEKGNLLFKIYSSFSTKLHLLEENQIQKYVKTMNNTLLTLQGKNELNDDEVNEKAKDLIAAFDSNNDDISEIEFVKLFEKDRTVITLLDWYGLMTEEDFDHIQEEADNEFDQDLLNEINLKNNDTNERSERIKSGIEHNIRPEDEMFGEEKLDSGDQFMAIKPAKGAIDNSRPSSYKPSKGESDPPQAELDLEFIHGYRCHDARNNLKYGPNGQIVYHAAGVGIVLDSNTRTQQFFMEHNDDILCLDVYENLVATGQIGHKPLICVWDLKDRSSKIVLKGVLEKGVVNICFSSDGKRLAASSLDEEHNIVVYDIAAQIKARENPTKNFEKAGLIASGKGAKAEIFDLKFSLDGKSLIAACNKEVYFIEIEEGKGFLKAKKALFGKVAPEPVMAIGFLNNSVVTGLSKGSLLVWAGNSVGKVIEKAHESAINAIHSAKTQDKLITGGNDGIIHHWDRNFNKLFSLSIKDEKIGSQMPRVRALCEKDGILLIGTRGSEIIEVKNKNANVLIKGHFDGELWGLTPHANAKVYYTVGEDMMLAAWDIPSRAQISNLKIPNKAKTIHMSKDAKYLAVGCLNGSILIISGDKKMNILNTLKNKNEVSVVKFSPNCDLLAAGFAPPASEVIIYNVKKNFSVQCHMKGCSSRITHLDFSSDSKVLQLNTSGYELLFFDAYAGGQLTHGASQNKDEKWASWTCVIGWPVQGIWPPCSDGSDINSVDRNNNGDIIATADDFGKVKLFKFPSAKEHANFNKYAGHSAHVTSVRFTADNSYLISTGGGEKTIFQWKFIQSGQNAREDPEEEAEEKKIQGIGEDEFGEEEVGEGDQMGACKPFLGELMNSIPTWYKPSKKDKAMPEGNLNLSYVFGYRCFDDYRNTAKFLGDGRIVFVGAAVGVVFDYKNNKQEFFNKHEEDIVSLAVHPKGQIVATGQMAAKGKAKTIDLYIWDSITKEKFCNLNHFHLRAVNQLCFSPDGTKILSTGQDDDNSLAIHDWASQALICTSNVDKAKVTGLAWKEGGTEFVTIGAKMIKFWTLNGRNVSSKKGAMAPGDKLTPFTCVTYAFKSNVCVTGSANGELATWSGSSLSKKVKAHDGEVGCLIFKNNTLYSGGFEGKVIIWDDTKGLNQKSILIEANTLTKYHPGIRSLDVFKDSFLIGTRGSELFVQEKGGKWNCVMQGHYDGEVWGCAASPKEHKFVSCGGDKTVRLWDGYKNKMITGTLPLKNDLRALDWSSNGEFIIAADVKGQILILNPLKLEIIQTFQSIFKPDPKKRADPWIEDIKISPNNDVAALGAHGGNPDLQILAIENNSKISSLKIINAANSSALTHLDFTEDGDSFVINTQDYNLRFFSVSAGKAIRASATKDFKYFTWTCTLGFYSQGIFPGVDGTDVNSLCRSHSQKYLVTGDDFGKLNIFNCPSVVPKSPCKSYLAHSSHVTKVKFSYDDSLVFSTGGGDKCVMTWKTDFGMEGEQKEEAGQKEEEDEEPMEEEEDCVKEKKKRVKHGKKNQNEEQSHDDIFSEETEDKGDEFMAVKPWLGAIKEPTGFKMPKNQSKPPEVTIELEYVFGYRAKDCRNNIRYTKSGNLVYHAAALGIVLDISNNTQRFFDKHIDDITAFDMHPNEEWVATGEIGPKPSIYIWDTTSLAPINQFKAAILKGIACLAFSPSGNKLVAAAIDDDHWIAVLDVKVPGGVICKVKSGKDVIFSLGFNSELEFATVGSKHYKYWKIEGANCKGTKGDQELKMVLNCCEFIDGSCIVGASDGTLFNCKGSSMGKPTKIHEKSIDALFVNESNIITGGKDDMIYILSRKMAVLTKIECAKILEGSVCQNIRSISLDSSGKKMVIGTYGSEIYELTASSSPFKENTTFSKMQCLMTGHYTPNKKWTNEVWGLAPLKDGDRFVSSSDDGTLRMYSSKDRKQIQMIRTNLDSKQQEFPPDKATADLCDSVKGRCIDVSPDGNSIAVGFKDGYVKIYDADSLEQNFCFKPAKEWISDLKYSPDGTTLAVGSHDNAIYLFNASSMKKNFVMNKHSSYITHIDWSENSLNIHSNCGAYELLFWDAQSGKQMPGGASALKDENWSTWTCVLGFPVQGIFPPTADGTDINYVDRSRKKHPSGYHLLASGDDFGKVRILRYPSIVKNSEAVFGVGHSSHVPCVKWSEEDEYLYSVGGEDNCVFQWKVRSS